VPIISFGVVGDHDPNAISLVAALPGLWTYKRGAAQQSELLEAVRQPQHFAASSVASTFGAPHQQVKLVLH